VKKTVASICVGLGLASVSISASAFVSVDFWVEPPPVVVAPYYPAYPVYPEAYLPLPAQRRFPPPYPYVVPAPVYSAPPAYIPYAESYGPVYSAPYYPGGSDMYVPAY
jgi:hypothetical protein